MRETAAQPHGALGHRIDSPALCQPRADFDLITGDIKSVIEAPHGEPGQCPSTSMSTMSASASASASAPAATSIGAPIGLRSATSVANLAKIVNIIESNVRADDRDDDDEEEGSKVSASSGSSVRLASSSAPRRSTSSYVPKSPQLEEIVFAKPTCMERFARYFIIVIYLCGLCCLGFFLSIYHIFFWDSRMPPIFKGQKKPAFG